MAARKGSSPRSSPRAALLVTLAVQGLRSSRTFVLLVLAVALGAGFQISNAANLEGFEADMLDDALVHGGGDVRVFSRGRSKLADADVLATRLAAETGALEGVPLLMFPGAVAGADHRFLNTAVWGVDAAAQRPPYRLIRGEVLPRGGGGERVPVLLGTAVAARLGVDLGGEVEVRAILGPKDPLLGESNMVSLRGTVRGIVSGTSGGYRAVFVDRAVLAERAAMPGAASSISLHFDRHDTATAVAAELGAAHADLDARGWSEDDPGWASYLGARKAVGGISYAMVIAAIAIPMWALLYIHVLRKRRELAILAALGFQRRELFVLSVLQSVAVAVIGCVVGVGIGYALTRYFAANPLFEWESLVVRPRVELGTFLVPCLVIVVTSVIAALHPAWRAARVDPAIVLRRIE